MGPWGTKPCPTWTEDVMFWRGVIGYLPVNIIQGVVGLLTIVAFTRLLTPAQFGDYALGFAVMSLVHTAVFTWNEAAMARFWAARSGEGKAVDHNATVLQTWVVLLGALPVAIAVALLFPLSPGLKLAVLAGLVSVLPRTFARLAQERRRASGEVSGAAMIDLVQTVGGFGLGLILARQGLGGAAPLVGMGLASAACCGLCLGRELTQSRGGLLDRPLIRDHLAYGMPVALSLILSLILSSTDRFLLATFLDQDAVGLYHAGYSLANRTLDVIFIWLGAAGGPALVLALERGGKATLAEAAREQASLMLVLTIPAAVGLAMVAAPLSELMIGPAMAEGAARVTPWIAASGLLAGLTTYYFHQAFTLGQKTPMLLLAMAVPAVANLILNLILIPRFGLEGALYATLTSYGLGLGASIWLGRRSMALPIPWLTLAQAGGAAALMALAVSQVPASGGLVELGLKAGLGGAVYLGLMALLDAGHLRSRALQLFQARRAA